MMLRSLCNDVRALWSRARYWRIMLMPTQRTWRFTLSTQLEGEPIATEQQPKMAACVYESHVD